MAARLRTLANLFGVIAIVLAGLVIAAPSASAATISQSSSSVGTVDVAGSAAYETTVAVSGNSAPVTFFLTSTPTTPGLEINASTGVITTTGTLPVSGSPYSISGTDSDVDGDSGSWSFSLAVTGDTISQTSATTGTVDVGGSLAYETTLSVSGNNSSAVTFFLTSTPTTPGLEINASTGVITTTGTLPVSGSPYSISGTDSDVDGDSGSWSFSLAVTGDTISQTSNASGTVNSNTSQAYSTTVAVSGNHGAVTFLLTSTPTTPGLEINASTGVITTTGALPVSGSPYSISGTDSDADGDSGTWAFALTVEPSNTAVSIVQTSTTTGATTSASSATFAPGSILVENNDGPVTFVTTVSSPALSVSSAGVISTTGILTAGSYTVSGTDSDSHSDSGTWTYTLTVTAVTETVTFDANAGSGSMAPESAAIPTALSLNTFIRPGYTFVDWNTVADGSGTSYANGAVYPFTASTTLYAQWELGKAVIHTVIFNRNGGSGLMAGEHENTPTALSANAFTRFGYTFVDWNTAANGSGTSYANHATYSFKSSVVLFAQWKKIPKSATFTVTFNAHGGKGTMPDERSAVPTALSANAFTRFGYTFVDWNTAANGSGTSYANHATYSFKSSVVLFAQWKVHHVVTPPAIDATALIGPFSPKSTTLTSRIDVQIGNLASEMKANHDTKVTLVGYGDKLTPANELNEAIWAANYELSEHRASAVDTYLVRRLSALGISGFAISAGGDGSSAPNSGGSSASKQSDSGFVIAKLS